MARTPPQRLILAVATGFGLGRLPLAPGTAGSLPGVLLALGLARFEPVAQAAVALLLALLAVPICNAAERLLGGRKDDGRIVADEWLLFPLCVVGLPLRAEPWLLLPAFVAARACDLLKPPPARAWQRFRGGWGIVVDDFIAMLYALALNHGLWRLWRYWCG